MDVRCERCLTQYVFDDNQVTETGVAVQCSKCGHLFRVKKKALVITVPVLPGEISSSAPIMADAAAHAPQPPPQPQPPPEKPREWRVRQVNGNVFTFKELTTLQKWIVERKVGRGDEISVSGDQWKQLGAISELAAFFQVVEEAKRARNKAPVITPPAFHPPGQDQQSPNTPVHQAARAAPATASWEGPPSADGVTRESSLPENSRAAPTDDPAWTNQSSPPPHSNLEDSETRSISGRRSRRPRLLLPILALATAGVIFLLVRVFAGAKPNQGSPALPAEPADPVASLPRPTTVLPSPAEQPDAPPEAAIPSDEISEPVVELPLTEPAPPVAAKKAAEKKAPDKKPADKKPAAKKPADKKPAAKKPEDPETTATSSLIAQARKLRDLGQSEKALDLLAQAIELEPEGPAALASRGWCYLDLSRYALAESSFQRALEQKPDFSEALMGIAETYRFQGKKANAVKYYEQYLAAHPKGEDAVSAQNAINKLKE